MVSDTYPNKELEVKLADDSIKSNLVDIAIVGALESLLEYAKYLSDHNQLSYDLLKQRVDSYKGDGNG